MLALIFFLTKLLSGEWIWCDHATIAHTDVLINDGCVNNPALYLSINMDYLFIWLWHFLGFPAHLKKRTSDATALSHQGNSMKCNRPSNPPTELLYPFKVWWGAVRSEMILKTGLCVWTHQLNRFFSTLGAITIERIFHVLACVLRISNKILQN